MTHEEYIARLRGRSLWWWLVEVVPGDLRHYRSLFGLRMGIGRAILLWRHYR